MGLNGTILGLSQQRQVLTTLAKMSDRDIAEKQRLDMYLAPEKKLSWGFSEFREFGRPTRDSKTVPFPKNSKTPVFPQFGETRGMAVGAENLREVAPRCV